MDSRRIKRVGILSGLCILLIIFLFNAPGIVTIESESGANLSIAESKDGEFKKIGTTKTTRFFFKKPTIFYVNAESNGKQTIHSFKPNRFTFKTIKLNLADTVPAQKISDGAVMDAYFDSNKGRGIAYGQNVVVDFRTDSDNVSSNREIAALPYVKKIIWNDFDNFVYLSSTTIGQFTAGIDNGDSQVASITSGDIAVDPSGITDSGAPRILDISKSSEKPLVLLSGTNIFTSNNFGTNLDAITSFEKAASETKVFTTSENIFKATYPVLNDDHDAKDSNKPAVKIDKYSYSGEALDIYKLEDLSEVISIVEKGNVIYILTQFGIHTIENDESSEASLYFANPADMTIYKDKIVVLGKDGLWQLNENDSSFQLLYKFSGLGTGLIGSISISPSNALIFGTTTTTESDKSATFSTSF